MLLLMVVAELPRGFAGSHYVGSNRNGQAEGEPGRRCRSIQVEEMPEQEAFDHTKDREHGLHHAKESGKKLGSALKNHSPLEGESARGRSPQSSRRGANAAFRK